LQQIAAYCSFWAGFPRSIATRGAVDNEFLMGKNGTGWDFFEGFQSHLAMFGSDTPWGSAAHWVLVVRF
jgi:hypothetical protein